MRKLSNRWKEKVKNGMDVQYLKYADITLTDGTVLNLTSANLWANGFSFEDSVSGDSSFDIGSAIINVLNLSINNFDGEYSDYDFEGAEVICYVGLQIEDEDTSELLDSSGEQILDSTGDTIIVHKNTVIEKTRICTATVVEQPEDETVTIDLTCEDNMRKFDRNYSDSKLKYPATRGQIVRDACEVCGVTLQTTSFDRDDYIVQARPSDDALTFRQVLQWVAQIGCQWLRCDEYGRLCVKWYDTEKIDAQEIDTTYSFTPQHTDVVITGIQVTEYSDSSDEEPESYMVGTQGYVLAISDNKLIHKGDGQTVASMIAEKCVGMVFRPFESECPTDVALEAGDAITIEDRNGNLYSTYLTTTTLQPGAGQNIACNAKSAAKNSSTRYSQITQVYVTARKMVKAEKTAREKALEEFGKRIDSATGVYTTVEPQENGSKIFYLHDKPTLAESQAIWKMTSEAWGVSTDGGQTWNGGMTVDGDTIVRILNAVGVNATWINTGAITVKDANKNILFQVDMDTKTVVINPDVLIIGNMTLSEKLENMDENIASAKNMTFQLSNDMQTITSDADGNIPVFPTVTTTAKVMYGSSDITNDCSYTITKSDSVTGSWDVDTHTYTVTDLSADNGWVDIKATYLQTLSITKRFTIAKLKAGKNGVNGLDGLQGERGEQGVPGKDGKDGTNGVDGKTSYFHIKYSSVANPTSSSQMTETPSTYIGTYVDYEPNDSTDPKKYTWSKFEGSDGKDGTPGTNGTDGKTYYLHIAYANSADGKTGFSVSDGTSKLYIGQYTDTVKEDSTDPTKYMWSKIKGEQGADGKPGRTYIIEPSCSVLKRSADNTISPNFLEFNAYYRDGDSATRYTYKGRFVIEETADGNTWTTIYRSTVDESTVKHYLYTILTDSSGQAVTDGNGTTVGIPRDITNIRCKLYASGGTTTLMDMQSVAVVIDVDNLTQSQIVEILSNDGAWKGLYYKNGQLYISFSAALGGELTLGGKNNGNGVLQIYAANGSIMSEQSNGGQILYDEEGLVSGIIQYDKIFFLDTSVSLTTTEQEIAGTVFSVNGISRYYGTIKKSGTNLIFSSTIVTFEDDDGTVVDPPLWFDRTHKESLHGQFESISVKDASIEDSFFTKAPSVSQWEYTSASNTVCWGGEFQEYRLMLKSSSSKRYKDIGNDISEQEIEEWYNIEPMWAKYKEGYLVEGDENEGRYIPMFIAEDVDRFFPEATRHQNGLVEDWNERIMIPAMFAMIKRQKSEIDLLKQELNEIKQLLRKE